MRILETLVLAAPIGLIGVAVWKGNQWPGHSASFPPAEAYTMAPSVAKKTKKQATKPPSRIARTLTPAAAAPPLPVVRRVAPPMNIPDTASLTVGTTRSELRQRYGAPALAIESVNGGNLVERYYYVHPDRTNMVVTILQNGLVVSSQTAQLGRSLQNLAINSASVP